MGESPGKIYAIAIILTLLATIFVGLRFHARNLKKAGCWWDEYMILPALLFTFITAVCMVVGTADGDLGRHTAIDADEMPIETHRTVILLQIVYATSLTTTLAIAFTKMAVLLFYKRIFQGTFINIAIWTNIGIVGVWSIGFFFSNLLQCWPISVNWATTGSSNYGSCINNSQMYLAQNYSDVFTDLLILALPIPCIWVMTMPLRHKFAVSGIFLLGLLTVCSGIAKVVVYNRANYLLASGASADISYVYTPLVYWPMIESALGIIAACLPLLRPLFSSGSESKGFGQVRQLRSVRLDSGSESASDLKPWTEDADSNSKSASEISISRIVPSALEPWEERESRRNRQVTNDV